MALLSQVGWAQKLVDQVLKPIDTLMGDIHPPKELMQTRTDRNIAEERRKTHEVQVQGGAWQGQTADAVLGLMLRKKVRSEVQA